PPAIRGTGYCVDALEAALWAVAGAADFREAVLLAANLGDDADTTAAIAGQLAGARWGASGISQRWRQRLTASDRIESLARGLFLAGGGEAAGPGWAHDEFVHAWWVETGAPARRRVGWRPGRSACPPEGRSPRRRRGAHLRRTDDDGGPLGTVRPPRARGR
ncbi:MAG: ADP-ribosylglycohydrolase family protein, partial [Acidimicrobiia bacterium]|nr:ADP-ribosylglycohydrolase family protein [Acidimicrobiia bacterium]